MKKLISLLLVIATCFVLAACGDSSGTADNSQPGSNKSAETESEPISITIPDYFEAGELEEIIGDASSGNYESITENEDGSVTLVMTQAQQQKLLSSVRETLPAAITDELPDEDCPSIKSIEFSDDFTETTLIVDYAAYQNSFDALYTLAAAFSCEVYQTLAGIEADNVAVTINVKDWESGEIEESYTYPDDYSDFLSLVDDAGGEGTEMEGSGNLGDYYVEIKGAKKVTDYEGNPAILITYSWTNNSEETTSPFVSVSEIAFQDGVEMELAIVDFEYNDGFSQVRPGATVDVDAIYELTSDSVVEFEVSEWLSFNNDIVSMDFDPTALE